ncbi:MAG: hypothetical protein GXP03_00050, partial [Alphaproteobacteria bacterium]|nr:hypothetical protein [Alphaproteobacteria bacterium]
ALFSPDISAAETLEIDDDTMIDAIEKIRAAIERRRPKPGRLRLWILLAIIASVLALGLFWLPDALKRQTLRVVPFETRKDIGMQLLAHITRLTGQPCTTDLGNRALSRLETRLLADSRGQVLVLRDAITQSTHLPGGIILLNKALIEDPETVDVAAGYILMEQIEASMTDPLEQMLNDVGGLETFRLLTTGGLSDKALRNYARDVMLRKTDMPPGDIMIKRFKAAGFASTPLAYALDITGETTLNLIEADPFRNTAYAPLISDGDWVSLQGICDS